MKKINLITYFKDRFGVFSILSILVILAIIAYGSWHSSRNGEGHLMLIFSGILTIIYGILIFVDYRKYKRLNK